MKQPVSPWRMPQHPWWIPSEQDRSRFHARQRARDDLQAGHRPVRNDRCWCGVRRLEHGRRASRSSAASRRGKRFEGRTHRRQAEARQEGRNGGRRSKAKDHSRKKDHQVGCIGHRGSAGNSSNEQHDASRVCDHRSGCRTVCCGVATSSSNRGHQRGHPTSSTDRIDTTIANHIVSHLANVGNRSDLCSHLSGTTRGVVAPG